MSGLQTNSRTAKEDKNCAVGVAFATIDVSAQHPITCSPYGTIPASQAASIAQTHKAVPPENISSVFLIWLFCREFGTRVSSKGLIDRNRGISNSLKSCMRASGISKAAFGTLPKG